MANLTGRTLGNYRVVERLGRGGMATVYKAYQPALERYVAIKVMHEGLAADADIVSIPVATSGNGPVDETDSDSGLEIAVYEPQSDQTAWTYASHMRETELDVLYIYAFADVSAFRGQRVELTITLRQLDVCAGSACTHDADFFIGDLLFERLPDICTPSPGIAPTMRRLV